ncbi:MAG: hypothetical protein R3F56_07080 [Planctomycetota bacterium]
MPKTLSILLLAATSASAQTLPSYVVTHDWPSAAPPSDFDRVVVGNFVGDQDRSVMLLADGQVWFDYAPAVHEFVRAMPLPGSCVLNDVATLEPVAATGKATLLGVGSWGLVEATYETPLPPNDPYLSLVTHSISDGWLGASRVVARRQDATTVVVAGLSADRHTLMVGTISGGVFSQGATKVYASAEVQDIDLLFWESPTSLRIAALVGAHLRILNQNTVQLALVTGTTVGGDLTVLHDTSSPTAESVAWARHEPAGSGWDLVVAAQAQTQTVPLTLTLAGIGATNQYDLCGIAGGLTTADGYADIVVSQRTTREVILVDRRYVEGSLDLGIQAALSLSANPATAQPELSAVPAFYDLDNDGDADVLAADENGAFVDRTVLFGGLREELYPGASVVVPSIDWLRYCPDANDGPVLDIVLGSLGTSVNQVEVAVWWEDAENEGMEPETIHWQFFDYLNPSDPTQRYARVVVDPVPAESLLGERYWEADNHLWGEVRFLDAQGIQVGPTSRFGLRVADFESPENEDDEVDPTDFPHLQQQGGAMQGLIRHYAQNGSAGPVHPHPSGRQFGGATTFPPNLPPGKGAKPPNKVSPPKSTQALGSVQQN